MVTEINGIEQYFEWWLTEMQSKGFIQSFKREPETLNVMPVVEYGRYKRFKSKEKEIESFNLFPNIDYTYDYVIVWNPIAEYLFYEEVNEVMVFQFGKPKFIAHLVDEQIISYVDVKPTNSVQRMGGKVSSAITFPLKQRMLWDSSKIYINKVVPMPMGGTGFSSALFVNTFTPQRYLLTDGGKALRKIKYKVITLVEYVEQRRTYITNLLKNTK